MSNDLLSTKSTQSRRPQLKARLSHRFSLFEDKAEDSEIESRIRDGVELIGATPWILMCAILVASVGLNVNSTAVIIGAMLISPLMGPIMGAGLGVAVYDFDLVKRALFNLAVATLISLIVSTLYFSISPLQQAQSELLARTTPTIWDVLIAFFGGLAGVIGMTRREKSNVIPGVAIATALMPPICTAGFGLATGQWRFFGGAFYLYTINCVFIILSTIIGIRILRLKRHGFADAKTARHVKILLWSLAICTALPSAYLTAGLIKDEVFSANARKFVEQEFVFVNTHVVDSVVVPKSKTIELFLIGTPLDKSVVQSIESRLPFSQLGGAKIIVHQSNDNKVDVASSKSALLSNLYQNSQEELNQKNDEIFKLQEQLAAQNTLNSISEDIAKELKAQYPSVARVLVSEGVVFNADATAEKVQHLTVFSKARLLPSDKFRIEEWFKVRIKSNSVILDFVNIPK